MHPILLTRPLGPASAMLLRLLLSTALLALAAPTWSQSPTGGSPAASPGAGSSGRSDGQRAQGVADEEREMFEDLAHASLAEIATGRLALENSQNPQVRSFAQQMIDDHQKALQELQQLGQSKQLTVPTETDFQHKAIATALRLLSGELFDKQYIRQVGINDHRGTVDLLQKMQAGSDPQLKAQAARLLPVVQRRLEMARALDQQMK